MSAGCQKVRQADGKIYGAPGRVTDRQNDSMTIWQNSRAAKEPALVDVTQTLRIMLCL